MWFPVLCIFARLFWRARETLVKQPPGPHLAHGIFKCIFMNECFVLRFNFSQKFVLKGPIDNKSALVQVMAGRRTVDKPLPEPMLNQFTDAHVRHQDDMN